MLRGLYMMEGGRIILDGKPKELMMALKEKGLIADFSRKTEDNGHSSVVLSAQSLDFAYGEIKILKDLSLDVRSQEIVAIVGANGCGKSTLLKHLNGLLRPKAGKVVLMGKDIEKATTASLANEIGYLGQNPNNYLFEETLTKELEFTLKSLRIDPGEWKERIDWSLKVLDLERYREMFPRDLSCGERERAALASVIVGKPKILVLDEPTRGLDYWNKEKMASILDALRKQGMTTILVTHDYRFVAEHATRVMKLEEGSADRRAVGQHDQPGQERRYAWRPEMRIKASLLMSLGAVVTAVAIVAMAWYPRHCWRTTPPSFPSCWSSSSSRSSSPSSRSPRSAPRRSR